MLTINTIGDFRRAMRNGKYTFPGGYPLYFIMEDGEAMSVDAARENRRALLESIADYQDNPRVRSGWRPVALDINFESELYCCQTGARIESAYPTE